MPCDNVFHNQLSNGQCSLVTGGKDFGPFSQIVHKHNGVTISVLGLHKLNDINTNSVKRPFHRNRSKWRLHRFAHPPGGTSQTASVPLNDVFPHAGPPIVSGQLTVDLSIRQMSAIVTTVSNVP